MYIPLNYNPTIVEESGGREYKFDVFSRLLRERIITIGDEIDDHMANIVCAQLLLLESEDPEKQITIYINSPGGSVMDGLAIYDTMQYLRSPVSTICIGEAASMASVLLLAGRVGKRFALKNSRIMIHQGSGRTRGQASDIEIYTKEMLRLEDLINKIMSQHTGQKIETLRKDQDRDNYMTAQQALDYGIVDQII
ncbi:MAG: ATP-dependent Clp protease proteolytic subunit [Candidatus Caenarcaniphilales bacterium]|nr:ATP-dependent Clp protease proteolytic subunit [Candidatus Caenarcaniphilales bacterium]